MAKKKKKKSPIWVAWLSSRSLLFPVAAIYNAAFHVIKRPPMVMNHLGGSASLSTSHVQTEPPHGRTRGHHLDKPYAHKGIKRLHCPICCPVGLDIPLFFHQHPRFFVFSLFLISLCVCLLSFHPPLLTLILPVLGFVLTSAHAYLCRRTCIARL